MTDSIDDLFARYDGMLSSQSFRVGVALDLLDSGESLERIMLRRACTQNPR
jgi:hypothetical protein